MYTDYAEQHSLLYKIVNSSMENINKILEKKHLNLTRPLVMDTVNVPWTLSPYSAVGHTIFSIFIINYYSIY